MKRVPAALCNVLTLETVCLSGNALDELPSQMGRLANLKELWIDNNLLKLLPPTMGGWVKMQSLLIHNNQLKMVPKNLPELEELQVLTLSGNLLTTLPWDLWKLTNLRELWLDSNALERLPEGIETMPSLKSVSCKHNPFFKDEVARADRIMELFPDFDGSVRLKQAAQEEAKERERQAVQQATLLSELDEEDKPKNAEDEMREEMEMLKKDLAEALENKDYDGADRIQTLIDDIAAKLAKGGDEFGRVASAEEDRCTFSITVKVVRCNALVSCTKKATTLSPYVS